MLVDKTELRGEVTPSTWPHASHALDLSKVRGVGAIHVAGDDIGASTVTNRLHDRTIQDLIAARGGFSMPKAFLRGTHRSLDPSETLADLAPDFSAFGVTRVARVTGLDRIGVEVFAAFRPNSRGLSVSQGKGATADAAKLSAIMEAIECFHAEHCASPLHFGTARDQAKRIGQARVVEPAGQLTKNRTMLWTDATDLETGDLYAVPFDAVHANFLVDGREGRIPGMVSTNGLASGANLVEALIHGICEVIERAATEAFDPYDGSATVVAPPFGDSDLDELVSRLDDLGLSLRVWETTIKDAPKSFVACIADQQELTVPPGFGAGCHLSPTVAIARAVHEAAQARLTRISGARDDLETGFFGTSETVRARFLAESGAPTNLARQPFVDRSAPCLAEDLWHLVDYISQDKQRPVLAIDLADDPRYRVVRVLIPSLDANLEYLTT